METKACDLTRDARCGATLASADAGNKGSRLATVAELFLGASWDIVRSSGARDAAAQH